MDFLKDELTDKILTLLQKINQPLETKEIENAIKGPGKSVTRAKVMYRLTNLRGDGRINGKHLTTGGKGVWIWWRK